MYETRITPLRLWWHYRLHNGDCMCIVEIGNDKRDIHLHTHRMSDLMERTRRMEERWKGDFSVCVCVCVCVCVNVLCDSSELIQSRDGHKSIHCHQIVIYLLSSVDRRTHPRQRYSHVHVSSRAYV